MASANETVRLLSRLSSRRITEGDRVVTDALDVVWIELEFPCLGVLDALLDRSGAAENVAGAGWAAVHAITSWASVQLYFSVKSIQSGELVEQAPTGA